MAYVEQRCVSKTTQQEKAKNIINWLWVLSVNDFWGYTPLWEKYAKNLPYDWKKNQQNKPAELTLVCLSVTSARSKLCVCLHPLQKTWI